MNTLLAVGSPSPLWYLTRGSGIVTLLLLTASVCLGVATSRRWRIRQLPRFVVAGLHRNLTLLAVAFLAIHVATTVADGYTPIGIKDAFVPFVSSYRPIWLGLGALACDLLLALVVTSLLRARIGYRTWRATHWLAYASWPLALVHALGTGSDARFAWMAALAIGCMATVGAVVLARIASGAAPRLRQLGLAASVVATALAIGIWYRSGPARDGWAARAGTPVAILASFGAPIASGRARHANALPRSFNGQLSGRLTESAPDGSGLVTVVIDTRVHGSVPGRLRLALRGFPTGEGGVSMTSSGVAFAGTGTTALYEGSIVGLNGNHVSADLSAPAAGKVRLALVLQIDSRSGAVRGTLHGVRA